MKKFLFCLLAIFFSLKTNAQESCCHNQAAAKLMVEKGLSKIVQPDARKNIIADRETTTEEYDGNCSVKSKQSGTPIEQICKPKSRKTSHKSTDLQMELRGLDIDDLYKALVVRHNFYIDPAEDTKIIDGKSCIIIKFAPKNTLTKRGITDQFINRVSGSIYIDLDNFSITRMDGFINEPFNFNYTLLGFIRIRVDVYSFEFSVEYSQFDNIMVEKSVNGSADYEIRNRGTEKYNNKITDYRVR